MSAPPPLSLTNAQERLLGAVVPLPKEDVSVTQAVGRYLAAPLAARRTQPAADLSAMDGYAVPSEDRNGPWTVVGESAAGHPYEGKIARGQAIRVSTGSLMPPGDNLVLLQENAERLGDQLRLNGEGEPDARHIRRAGFDFREGHEILAGGTRIGPGQLALALAAGHDSVPVHRVPSVAVLDSGDELTVEPGICPPHKVPASNGAMIAAMAEPYAASIKRIGPVADRMEALAAALARAEEADVLVTTGGASVGDHDLIRPALEQWGAQIDFWRVAVKPGKPLLVARRGEQWILGLPGNPVSSYVTAFLFLLPLLRTLGGAHFSQILPTAMQAFLTQPLPPTGARQEFVRAKYAHNSVTPLDQQDSSALRSLAHANALIDRKADSPAVEPGQAVWLYLLENGGNA